MNNKVSNPRSIYLLGAGFTKAFFPDVPLNKELLQALINNKPGGKIAEYYEKYKTDDIEQLLTQLDLEAFGIVHVFQLRVHYHWNFIDPVLLRPKKVAH